MVAISVVIPAKNEQDNVEPLIQEIVSALHPHLTFEIVFVDDGSTDETFNRLVTLNANQYPMLRAIKHEFSVGQSTAIQTGIHHAKGKLIATLDADGQNDPADIPHMLELANQQPINSDFCIAGYRNKRKGDTKWKQIQSKIANSIRSFILQDNTPDTGCGLKIFPRSTYLLLPHFNHMHRFIPALIRRLNGNIVISAVNHRERNSGQSNYTMLNRLWVGIIDMLGVAWLQRRKAVATITKVVG